MRVFVPMVGLFLCVSFIAQAQRLPDSVSATQTSGCCYDFLLKNRNSNHYPIDMLEIVILSAADANIIQSPGPVAPSNWHIGSVSNDTVRFVANPTSVGLRTGMNLGGFLVCFANRAPSFTVRWKTYYGQIAISTGDLTLSCRVSCDEVSPQPLGNCCYNWVIRNRNSSALAINDFHLSILTAGVTFASASPAAAWQITQGGAGSSSVIFTASPTGGGIIGPGKDLDGFLTCFDIQPGVLTPIRVRWATTLGGREICVDTITLRCIIPAVGCDSVGIKMGPDCCYEFVVANRNASQTPIADFHVAILTPGVSFASTPTAPTGWTVATGANDVSFVGATPIPPAGLLGGFITCFKFDNGVPIPFRVAWQTTDQKHQTICIDTVDLQCTGEMSCDSVEFTQKPGGPCCYSVRLKNRHVPYEPLNDFHIKIVSSGASFVPSSVSSPWPATTLTPTELGFASAASALPSGDDLTGIDFCLQVASEWVTFYWESTLDGKVICSGYERVKCEGGQEQCDSVRIGHIDKCCFDFVLKNVHQPPSTITDFHIEVVTPGVVIQPNPPAPAGWVISSQSPTDVFFKEITGFGLPTGNLVGGFKPCFDNIPSSGVFEIVWCTTRDDNVICCEKMYIQCAPTEMSCDSVKPKKRDDCCYDFTVQNRHLPAGLVTDFHIEVLTPGVVITGTPSGPGGWTVTSTSTRVDYNEPTGNGIPHMGEQNGFVLCFDRIPSSGLVELRWCTTEAGNTICCDTLRIECPPSPVECDEVTPSLIDSTACCWDFRVFNRHQPPSILNDFHVRIITPGVFITAVNKPMNWTVSNNTTSAVFSTATSPLASMTSLSGFVVCFDTRQIGNRPFEIVWETTIDQRVVCTDTMELQCATTGVERLEGNIPSQFQLLPNYPNPFSASTTIAFDIPEACDVELTVVDAAGRTFVTLVRGRLEAGRWQAVFDGTPFASGTYRYILRAKDVVLMRSMVLLK